MSKTIGEMNALIGELLEKRKVRDEKKEAYSLADQDYRELKVRAQAALEEAGVDKFASDAGTVYKIERMSVKIPGSQEAKGRFFNYLKERGLFEKLATVHSATLNSLYKEAYEHAVEEGKGMEFRIPGIDPHTVSYDVGVRKK